MIAEKARLKAEYRTIMSESEGGTRKVEVKRNEEVERK